MSDMMEQKSEVVSPQHKPQWKRCAAGLLHAASGTFKNVEYSPHDSDWSLTPTSNHLSFPTVNSSSSSSSSIGALVNNMSAKLSEENIKMNNQQLTCDGAHTNSAGIASVQRLDEVLSVANNTLNVLFSAP